MAYADDAVRAKLSALNETQDSIVSVAQWIIFHRRHADRTAELWLERLKDSNPPKKVNLIYLANEATSLAYKSGTQDTGGKIKRVVEVWRQRNIFDLAIQDTIEKRIQEVDKSRTARSGGARLGGSLLGGSLFSNSSSSPVPPELQALAQPQSSLSRSETAAQPLIQTANTEYAKLTDPNTPVPSPPVHAARLSSLLKNLAAAEGAVDASLKARNELIAGLEKLLDANKSKLAEEQKTHSELLSRRTTIEAKKKDVEDGIMRGLSADASAAASSGLSANPRPTGNDGSPEVESFTPPPPDVENFTPTGSPEPAYPADDNASLTRPASNSPAATTDPRLKRRKMNHSSEMDEELFSTGEGVGLDKDVAAMLGAQ
ncbi:unnamed protein product [Aureobasidium vineae]|uniref:CID domain-containing protein n=1 Tax=Aureobasidium vineae TaxID=2773715 RepID=A0A9N8J7U9_9PEZI|nr:unnamed protein product [Aureobasidium vineae]